MFLDYYNLQPLFMAIHSALCSVMPEGLAIFLEGLVVGVVILVLYAVLAIILIYMERKVCAAFQCRIGPNRVGGKGGLLQVPADVIKILTKEIISLKNSDHFLYNLAPFLVILASILTFSCLPWNKGGEILHMNIGIFFVLAASSIGVLGILLAGWSSNSKYTIIGAVRSGAMIISYELSIGLTVLTMVMLSPVASICYQGLMRIDEGVDVVERSVVSYGGVQAGYLEKGCSWITLFIAMAPSLGFLGTVIGMVMAFDNIQRAGDISPTVVAGGMKVALITTIFGLIVALILQVFYNYILSKIEAITSQMEDSSITLLDMIMKYNLKYKK